MCAMALRSAGVERVYYAMSRDQAAQAGYDYRSSYDVIREDALGRDLPCRHAPAPEAEAMLARWPERAATPIPPD
ncbi:hypothetical protein C882_3547 [Caenispirillum salinarum AK4]|uniref:Uncharacterized protein n=2 Tax=Caenispirillum TaxID=414051 RepID=K9HU69_9PROT|nr:hypothetical protein C882_3547 [Caenispirillum salinarum AK4]